MNIENKYDIYQHAYMKYLNNNEYYNIFIHSYQTEILKELHHHDHYEIIYIINGVLEYQVEGIKFNLYPGDFILISPKILHSLLNSHKCKRAIITITKKVLADLSSDKTNLFEVFEKSIQKRAYRIRMPENLAYKLISNLDNLSDKKNFGSDLMQKFSLTKLLCKLNEYLNPYDEIQLDNKLIYDITIFINENLDKDLRLEVICKKFHISNSYLSHSFKKELGIPISKYIIKKRLQKSKELLIKDLSIYDVSLMCGIKDYNSFFRSFKSEYGITPKEYINYENEFK
ncbi:MAG: AraC family transcriptional regulator [Anaeroplasmataceae bacterium]